MTEVSRRHLLKGVGALGSCLLCQQAYAIGDHSKLRIVQLQYKGDWDPRPRSALVLAQEVRYRTSIDVQLKRHVRSALSKDLFEYPFAVLLGSERFRFTTKERARLKNWIEGGGFLLVDNNGRGEPSKGFDTAFRTEMASMMPGRKLTKIPPQHVLYRCFYVLNFPAGRAIHRTFLEGIFIDDRLAVLYTQNDLCGALDRDRLGAWTYDVVPGGEVQREQAKRLAINAIQYAMCLDYKDDQVHLDYLLHKRRWRIKAPKIE